MDKMTETLQWLDSCSIAYELVKHPPAYTIEDMDSFALDMHGHVCKNLFLRDAKGTRHFIVSLDGHKSADLKQLGALLGTKLSFASEERLGKYLNLTKGAVTPLGAIFDKDAAVELLLDEDLQGYGVIGVHPCVNTATVFMSYEDLVGLLAQNGNALRTVKL